MTSQHTSWSPRSPAYRRRRAVNWVILGLTYSAMYTGRYNLSLVNPILSKNYNWDKTEIGGIISPALLAYGIFAIFNGMVSDRLGGRRSFLIGAVGASLCNLLFGLGAYLGVLGKGSLLLGYFATIWMMNSYFQSFGAVSMVKINAAWFERGERGVFSAVFGSMIQMGRTLIFAICPLLMLFLSWEWLFFLPSLFILTTAILSFFFVADDPQQCGFQGVKTQEVDPAERKAQFKWVLNRIFKNPVTLSIALAEFCTGFVRQGFEQWFPRYLIEVQNLPF